MWIDSRAAMSPAETWQTGERMNSGRMTLLKRDGVELPLRAGPIRFAVLRKVVSPQIRGVFGSSEQEMPTSIPATV